MGSKKLEVICPCCETKLQVDKKTGEIIWEERKAIPVPSLTNMVKDLDNKKRKMKIFSEKIGRIRRNEAGFSMKSSKNQQSMWTDPAKNLCGTSIWTNH